MVIAQPSDGRFLFQRILRHLRYDVESIDNRDDDRVNGHFLVPENLGSTLPFLNYEDGIPNAGIDRIDRENIAADKFTFKVDGLHNKDFAILQVFIFLRRDYRTNHFSKRHTTL